MGVRSIYESISQTESYVFRSNLFASILLANSAHEKSFRPQNVATARSFVLGAVPQDGTGRIAPGGKISGARPELDPRTGIHQ